MTTTAPLPPVRHLLRARDLADVRYAEDLTVDDLYPATQSFHECGVIGGISAIGVPILDEHGTPFAAISVAAATKRLDERRRTKILDLIVSEAAKLHGRLGLGPGSGAPGEAV